MNTQREQINSRLSLTEFELEKTLRACCEADEQSRKYLYMSYYSFVMGVTVRYLGKGSDAEELVNDSFIKIFKNLDHFNATGYEDQMSLNKAFKAWIAKISSRTAIDFLRIAKNKRRFDEISDDLMAISHLNVTDKINGEAVLRLLEGLPEIQKVIFNLFEMDGYSHKEVSAILNISERQSSVYLARAKSRLRLLYINDLKLKERYHA